MLCICSLPALFWGSHFFLGVVFGELDAVGFEGVADLVDVGAVDADGLVENLAGDAELFGPVVDVGGELGVDLLRVGGNLVAVLGFGVAPDFDATRQIRIIDSGTENGGSCLERVRFALPVMPEEPAGPQAP